MSKVYKIFISHSWTYSDTLMNLRNLLNARSYFFATYEESTKDKPINSTDESYVKSRLSQKIRDSDIVIGIAGISASHSDWIEWELDTAQRLSVPIIGVAPWGQARLSTIVSSRAIEMVRWNTESIVSSVRNHAR